MSSYRKCPGVAKIAFFFFLFPSSPWGQIKLEIFFFLNTVDIVKF